MTPLGDTLPPAPGIKVYRANRRQLYILVTALVVIGILVVAAWISAGRFKREQTAQNVHQQDRGPTQAAQAPDLAKSNPASKSQPPDAKLPTQDEYKANWPGGAPPPLPPLQLQQPLNESAAVLPEAKPLTPKQQLEKARLEAMRSPFVPSRAPTDPPAPSSSHLQSGAIEPADLLKRLNAEDKAMRPEGIQTTQTTAADDLYQHSNESTPTEYAQQNQQAQKSAFAGGEQADASPVILQPGTIPTCMLRRGDHIPAILVTAINTDLPGPITARVDKDVFDTDTGTCLVIAKHTILVGKYNASLSYAQRRVQVDWETLEPRGEPAVDLRGMPGASVDGTSGLTGGVDNHYKRLIGMALLTSTFAAGISVSQTRNYGPYGYPTAGQSAAQAVGQQMAEMGRSLTEKNASIQPTGMIPAGYLLTVDVKRDIIRRQPTDR